MISQLLGSSCWASIITFVFVNQLWAVTLLIVQFLFLLKDNGSKWTEFWKHYLCKSSGNLKEQHSSLNHCKNKHFWWVEFIRDVFLCMWRKAPVFLALEVQDYFTFFIFQLALGVKSCASICSAKFLCARGCMVGGTKPAWPVLHSLGNPQTTV